MKLYRTPLGQWVGTQMEAREATRSEGSKPGSWRAIEVPTHKDGLIRFLNNGWAEPKEAPAESTKVPRKVNGDALRWRVFVKNLFACVVYASTGEEALQIAQEETTVRLDLSV